MINEEKYSFGKTYCRDVQPLELIKAELRDSDPYRISVPESTHALVYSDGICEMSSGGSKNTVQAPTLLFLKPRETVSFVKGQERSLWVYVLFFFVLNSEIAKRFPAKTPYFSNTFPELADVVGRTDLPEEAALSKIYEAAYLSKRSFPVRKSEKNYVLRACRYIEDNLSNKLSVNGIAESLSVNRQYLTRLFKHKTGSSLQEYIIGARIKKALEYLDAGYSVSETAAMVGYGDQFGFTRIFSKKTGMSPTKYKASRLQEE